MATKMHRPTDGGEDYLPLGPDIDRGPSPVRLAVVRLLALAVAVGAVRLGLREWHAVRLGLREWHAASMVLVVLGAAWVLGRVD